jgi:glutamate-ammonia-ligase adenylyltransferase
MERSSAGSDACAAFVEAGGSIDDPRAEMIVSALAEHARSLLPLVIKEPRFVAELVASDLERPLDELALGAELDRVAASSTEEALHHGLRRVRHRTVLRIALREVLRLADIDTTSAEMSILAAACTDAALRASIARTRVERGELVSSKAPIAIAVLGMGKLGGNELNLGSDIDICFFYSSDDASTAGGLSAYEWVASAVKRTVRAISEVTEHGFCFRVDLRLRPEGSRGPIASSLDGALRYYEHWGRTWERAALLRARPIAGDLRLGEELKSALAPFIFRKSVDPTIAVEMRELLERSRRELSSDSGRDLKLGRGGIREAEFFVQTLQLVWGGQHPELRVSRTIEALRRLVAAGLVSEGEGQALEADWALLRRAEHRIHVQAGYQTHALPSDAAALSTLARSLGFEDALALGRALEQARKRIATLYDTLTSASADEAVDRDLALLADEIAGGQPAAAYVERLPQLLGVSDADAAAAHLARLGQRATSLLGPVTRERDPKLGPRVLDEIARTIDPDLALQHLSEFFGRLGGSWGFERLLSEQPRLLRRLVGLFGSSVTLSRSLASHPAALEDLLAHTLPTREGIDAAHAAIANDPFEEAVARLRRAKVLTTLEVGLAWVGEDANLADVEALLTALAEAQIRTALSIAARAVDASERELVIVGMGKLGGRELGFGSDLDLFFLYEGDGDPLVLQERATRLAHKTMSVLSQPNPEGIGYEIDTRLRPSGSHGMLVVSVEAFDRYHHELAEDWERQALVRARPVAGADARRTDVARRIAEHAYGGTVDGPRLAHLRCRLEVEVAAERARRYDPKLGFGALLDVELIVQATQLRHGSEEGVRSTHTLEALHALAARGRLDAATAETLASAHTFFRSVEQALRFMDERRELAVEIGGRRFSHLARRLHMRARDGESSEDVLVREWQHHAEGVRAIFEELIGKVGTEPPWRAA